MTTDQPDPNSKDQTDAAESPPEKPQPDLQPYTSPGAADAAARAKLWGMHSKDG